MQSESANILENIKILEYVFISYIKKTGLLVTFT